MRWRSLAGLAGLVLTASTAGAQSISNPGFETGDLTGWIGDPGPCGAPTTLTVTSSAAHTGNYGLNIVNTQGCDSWIKQPVAFQAGHWYNVMVWAQAIGGDATTNSIAVEFGTASLYSFGGGTGVAPGNGWTQVGSWLANVPQDGGYLWIGASNTAPGGSMNLDDVTITDITDQYATTPEPSSLALLGTGLVGLVPIVRRRTRA